jgi:hypothetical protein
MLTRDQVEQSLPATLKGAATQQFTDRINNIVSDPVVAEQIRDNFVSYTSVLKDGRFKTEDYLSAVTYVSFKLMGLSNQEAYMRTFPQRYQQLLAKNTSAKDISAYVSAYNKGKLVNLILEQTLVPSWVLNQDIFQKAINTQFELMTTAQSEKVRTEAANSILTHLKRPETKAINLNLGVNESSGLTELKAMMTDLAQRQREAIENGTPTKLIAAQPIVDAEYSEVDTDKTGTR